MGGGATARAGGGAHAGVRGDSIGEVARAAGGGRGEVKRRTRDNAKEEEALRLG